MKIKILYISALLVSTQTFAMNEAIEVDKKEEVNQKVENSILETANLMDEINLLRLELEKEMLNKSLNEERLNNIEIKNEISKYYPKKEIKRTIPIPPSNPSDGPFNSNGIRLLSVTSLQNMGEMVAFSFYGRKYNRSSGDQFKGSYVSINDKYVIFKYRDNDYKFSY